MKTKSTPQSGFINLRLLGSLVLFIIGLFVGILAFGFYPSVSILAQSNIQPSKDSTSTADARVAEAGKEVSWVSLPQTAPLPLEQEMEEEPGEPFSDIDPTTLRELKRKAFVPPRRGSQFPNAHNYSATEDGATAAKVNPQDPSTNITPAPLAPNLIQNFVSLNDTDQLDGFIHTPPDTDMAAGPNHVMTVVNALFGVYSKTGNLLLRASMPNWFANVCNSCNAADFFDPRITYDSGAGRWIMVELYKNNASVTSKILVSISQTSDPTGSWWNYSLDGLLNHLGENTWADYPDVGFDGIPAASGGAIYVTVNQFTFSPVNFRTAALHILPKASLYSGASLNYWRASNRLNSDGSQAFTLRASKSYGNPGGEFLINTKNNGNSVSLWRVNPTYPPTAVDWTLRSTVNIDAYSLPPNATQPGSSDLISTLDNRIYNAVWQNDRIYAGFTLAYNWGSGTVAAVHYLKINTISNTAEINLTYGADGFHYYSPAIATDSSDNIVLVFSRSNSTEFAGARYTGQLTTEPNTQGSAQLRAGTTTLFRRGGETASRWGDYQAAAVDPVDRSKVWIYGEWTVDLPGMGNDFDWGTWIGQVQFASNQAVVTPDFNRDGNADLIWQNNNTGQHSIWLMNGTAWNGSQATLLTIPPAQGWQMAGTGDFNHDNNVDILWENTSTGQHSIWLMNGTAWNGSQATQLTIPPAEGWRMAGTGDFNHDGNVDIVWQNFSTGQHSIWLMTGTVWNGSQIALLTIPPAQGWQIATTGDFDHDGNVDIVWENNSTGQHSIWLMNGTVWNGSQAALLTIPPAQGWRIAGASDFSRDGNVDIVWQNFSTGQHSIWLMNGTTWNGSQATLLTIPASQGWEIRNH